MPHIRALPAFKNYKRDLRQLATLTASGITFAGLLLLAIIAYAGWASNDSATKRERNLLQNGLNRGIARALNEQKSVAWWDESVTKITNANVDLAFTDSNFGVFLTETYGHDEIYIVNADGRPLYGYAAGARSEPSAFDARQPVLQPIISAAQNGSNPPLKQRPDSFGDDQTHYKTLGSPIQNAHWNGHILAVDGRLAIVAAMTIVPNVDASLLKGPPNVLISVTYIDDEYVQTLGRSLLLSDLAITPERVTGNGMVSEPFVGDDGISEGYLSWTTQRPGQVLINVILPLVALGLLAAAVLANGMIVRLKLASSTLSKGEAVARHAAKHDDLSGLPNRVHFAEILDTALSEPASARDGKKILVAFIDIDRFKEVNDTLGHQAGDELVKLVAQRLQDHVLPDEILSRYGGDEFAILRVAAQPGADDSMKERIQRALAAPIKFNGQTLVVTASVGIAVAADTGATVDQVMRHADIALYEAKNQGRNRVVYFREDMAAQVEERRAVELDLRDAIANDELQLHYQPIVSCQTGEITGVEALARWRHATKGQMSPATFIPIAEQSGLMPALGAWVLSRAMSDAREWPQLHVSINLSPVQFRQSDIVALLKQITSELDVSPSQFILEITEGVLLESCDRTSRTLDGIHELGFRTALDDFGTGYSSLAYLCNFRFSKIKIDRSFVAGLSKSESFRKIVHAVVALGKGLGMQIVAEGVETEAEAITMTKFGCSEMQGYYFSRPIDKDQLTSLLKTYQPKTFSTERLSIPALEQNSAAA